MAKKPTSNKVIIETLLTTGMSQTEAAAVFNVSTRSIDPHIIDRILTLRHE
ncbi:helix-turn-helix domain-containing protein [Corynebacterium epidermidicanis]|uniref:hypothetical protein n=1 Tax=Corynebacterium epidermidicanis TaxID=1050174 RepID=UPI00130E229B|nr:hypothetical protein [Corynebacterium epidermidicanis]